jgi:hypothetical protein
MDYQKRLTNLAEEFIVIFQISQLLQEDLVQAIPIFKIFLLKV